MEPRGCEPNTASRTVIQQMPSSSFNPTASSFNPGAPTFQSIGMKPMVQETESSAGGAGTTPSSIAIASPGCDVTTVDPSERRGTDINPAQITSWPHRDNVSTELSAPHQSPAFSRTALPLHSPTPPKSAWVGCFKGVTIISRPYEEHSMSAARPSMLPAGGWGVDRHMGIDINDQKKARNETSSSYGGSAVNSLNRPGLFSARLAANTRQKPSLHCSTTSSNAPDKSGLLSTRVAAKALDETLSPYGRTAASNPGMGLGVQFPEGQWLRSGTPNQPTRKESGIDGQTRYVNQLRASLGVMPRDLASYPIMSKSGQLPQAPNGRNYVEDWRTHIARYSETVGPSTTSPIFQPVPNPPKPSVLTSHISDTPTNLALNIFEPSEYFNHHHEPMGQPTFHQQLPLTVATPKFSYGDYHAQRYGSQLNRPSTTKSLARAQRSKPLGRRKANVPRVKRTDQGPMPSSADIYPDDAQIGNDVPMFGYENMLVGQANGDWDIAKASQTTDWDTTIQAELRRQADAERQHNAYLRNEEEAQELEDLIRTQNVHDRMDVQCHENEDHRHNIDMANDDYNNTPVHVDRPPVSPPGLNLPTHILPQVSPIYHSTNDRFNLPSSSPPTTAAEGHSTSFSLFNSTYYRNEDQVKASLEIESRPLSPAQVDGSRYGVRFWGIGIGDSWRPAQVAPGRNFDIRPREHEGWGGWEWVEDHETFKDNIKRTEILRRLEDAWEKET